MAQASASNGSGRRRGEARAARITGPISGSRLKRAWNSERSWSSPRAKRMRSMPRRARAPRLRVAPLGQARSTTGWRSTCRSLTRAALPRRRSTPSRPAPGSGRRRAAPPPARRPALALEQVDVDQEGTRPGDLDPALARRLRARTPGERGRQAPGRASRRPRPRGSPRFPPPRPPVAAPAVGARAPRLGEDGERASLGRVLGGFGHGSGESTPALGASARRPGSA